MEQSKWTSTSTDEQKYTYRYTSNKSTYYGIHQVHIQYKDNPIIEVTAKFDTGAKSSSIDYSIAKKLGVEDEILEAARTVGSEEIDKTADKKNLKSKVKDLSETHKGIELDSVRSASGVSIRAYIPITIFYNGRIIKTSTNLKDRTGLKAEMLIGLDDML